MCMYLSDVDLSPATPSVNDGERHLDRVYCHQGATVTTAVVVIDANLARLSVSDRVAIVRRFARYFHLPVTIIQLIPSSKVIDLGLNLFAIFKIQMFMNLGMYTLCYKILVLTLF